MSVRMYVLDFRSCRILKEPSENREATLPHLHGVCKELQGEDECESLVGVPEDGGVADGVHRQRHAVVQELGRDRPPRVLRWKRQN